MFAGPAEMIQPTNLKFNSNGQGGVQEAVFGNDGAVAYEFSTISQHNVAKSEMLGFAHYDLVEVIYSYPDQYTKTCTIVTDFHRQKYADAYARFKAGLGTKGTKIKDWQMLDEAQRSMLIAQGIYTVEQLAEVQDSKLATLPPKASEWIKDAKHHVKSQSAHEHVKDYAADLAAMNARLTQLAEENQRLQAQMAGRSGTILTEQEAKSVAPRKRGRPGKVTETTIEE